MTHRDLVAVNDRLLHEGCRRAAERRLRMAKGLVSRAQGRSRVRFFAERELECAKAEAQEWGAA